MKKIIFSLLITVMTISLVACNNATKTDTTNTKDETKTEIIANDSTTSEKIGKTIHLTTEEFKKLVANYDANPNEWKYLGNKPCIVDFWATWCPPCKAIAPTLEELAAEYKNDIYIYKIDVDDNKELAQVFGIQSIPTLLFVPMSGQPETEIGAISKEKFKEKIDNFLLK